MSVLRLMCNVTRLGRIRNKHIRGIYNVTNIAGSMRQNILKWFGHDERKNNDHIVKKID